MGVCMCVGGGGGRGEERGHTSLQSCRNRLNDKSAAISSSLELTNKYGELHVCVVAGWLTLGKVTRVSHGKEETKWDDKGYTAECQWSLDHVYHSHNSAIVEAGRGCCSLARSRFTMVTTQQA